MPPRIEKTIRWIQEEVLSDDRKFNFKSIKQELGIYMHICLYHLLCTNDTRTTKR